MLQASRQGGDVRPLIKSVSAPLQCQKQCGHARCQMFLKLFYVPTSSMLSCWPASRRRYPRLFHRSLCAHPLRLPLRRASAQSQPRDDTHLATSLSVLTKNTQGPYSSAKFVPAVRHPIPMQPCPALRRLRLAHVQCWSSCSKCFCGG